MSSGPREEGAVVEFVAAASRSYRWEQEELDGREVYRIG